MSVIRFIFPDNRLRQCAKSKNTHNVLMLYGNYINWTVFFQACFTNCPIINKDM
jgi:hypothetical protein